MTSNWNCECSSRTLYVILRREGVEMPSETLQLQSVDVNLQDNKE
jgi:hypothetical protein